jgi:excisionase family DNA binding protein
VVPVRATGAPSTFERHRPTFACKLFRFRYNEVMQMPAYSIYTIDEAATVLALSPQRVRRFCAEGRLGKRLGRRWVIAESDLEEFKKKERRPGRPSGRSGRS